MKTVNNIFKHTFFCLALGTTVCSCDLDVEPTSSIATETFWTSEKDAWYNLNAVYSFPGQLFTAIRIRTMHTANIHGNRTELFISKTVSVPYMTKAITSKQSANKTFSCRK